MARGDTNSDLHGWGPMLADLAARQRAARAMGGEQKLAQQAERGQLNARQRIEALLDPGSFRELGTLVGGASEPGDSATVSGTHVATPSGTHVATPSATPADAFPAGFGLVEGRPVLVGAEDFSVMGGSIGLAGAGKRYRLTQLAAQERVPLVLILQGAGHRMTNALKGHARSPNDLQGLVDLAGLVPTVCVVLGASAGHGALAAPLMDFAVMSEQAALFSAGPPLVEAAIGEKISKQDLGGPQVHVATSGVVHNLAPTDGDALAIARTYLGYFPSNAWGQSPRREGADTGPRELDDILALIPPDSRRPYPMREVLSRIVDQSSLFEVQPRFGGGLVTALARVGGEPVAIVANDPSIKAGTIDTPAAEKGARFIEVVGGFGLPFVFLADNPGVAAGSAAERAGALRSAARMFAAQHRLRGPKIHVTVRKAFGFGSSIMAMNPFDGQTLSIAFPGATLGAMPARGGGVAARVDGSIQAALDAGEGGGPYRVADSMAFDEIIDPRQLRNVILDGLDLARTRDSSPRSPERRIGALP